jgi:solute carrier family 35 protein C2
MLFYSSNFFFFFGYFRYQKLQKGHAGDNVADHDTKDSAAKYVILEEVDEQDDGI